MIVIVDYGMGNLGSMVNMFKKIGSPAVLSSDPAVVARAGKLVLPGVGAFASGMTNLSETAWSRCCARAPRSRCRCLVSVLGCSCCVMAAKKALFRVSDSSAAEACDSGSSSLS